jgi:hypothetical protein
VGGALRQVQAKQSLLFYTDYDLSEKSINAFMASGTWLLAANTRITATLDVGTSPIRKGQQKYLKQSTASTEGWKLLLPSARMTELTKDGSGAVGAFGFGLSHAFSKRLTLSGDIALVDGGSDDESDDMPLHESLEYFSHFKLSAHNFMIFGDSNRLDLRHNVSDSSQLSSASIDSRYDISPYWTVNPRFSTDYSTKGHGSSESWVRSSAIKMEYRWKAKGALQFELGGRWLDEETPDLDKSYATYFLALGYETKF